MGFGNGSDDEDVSFTEQNAGVRKSVPQRQAACVVEGAVMCE
jgi:hypothetical protein